MVRQFKFVVVSDPTTNPSSESKKLAYSHAFRQAHAQRRSKQVESHRKNVANKSDDNVSCTSKIAVSSHPQQLFDSYRDPFSSWARPVSSVEYFLLNHYVNVIVPFTLGHCDLFDYPGDHKPQLLKEWVGLAITDNVLMLAAVLLSTCRYILRIQPSNFTFIQMALQYKQVCLQTLQQEMTNSVVPIKVTTVAKAIALTLDEVALGEHTIARKHLSGLRAMVDSSGGAERLGLKGLLEGMYRKLVETLEPKDSGTNPA